MAKDVDGPTPTFCSVVLSCSRCWRARSQIPKQDCLNPCEPEQCRSGVCGANQEVGAGHRDSQQGQSTVNRLIAHLKKLHAASRSPIGERLDACQRFVERAQKRHAAAQEAVKKDVKTQIGGGVSRGCREIAQHINASRAPPMKCQHCGFEFRSWKERHD